MPLKVRSLIKYSVLCDLLYIFYHFGEVPDKPVPAIDAFVGQCNLEIAAPCKFGPAMSV